jgi:putative tryptophan/tyrosine transport system substrate-binding protein
LRKREFLPRPRRIWNEIPDKIETAIVNLALEEPDLDRRRSIRPPSDRPRGRQPESLLGGAAATWPLVARAQQTAIPVVGFLYAGTLEEAPYAAVEFRKGLSEMGYVEGRNVAIEYRSAQNENKRLSELASDLVRHRVAVIATPGSPTSSGQICNHDNSDRLRRRGDPVRDGLVTSFNRPGGNITGVSTMRLGLLLELMPGVARFAVLFNPNAPSAWLVRLSSRDELPR